MSQNNDISFKRLFYGEEAQLLHTLNDDRIKDMEYGTKENLDFSMYLADKYHFDKLILDNQISRKLFAFSMAQCWFATRTHYHWRDTNQLMFLSPLAVMLGSNYELRYDEKVVIEELTGGFKIEDLILPFPLQYYYVDPSARYQIWPFLFEFQNLPYQAIKAFTITMLRKNSGNEIFDFTYEYKSDPSLKVGTDILEQVGILEYVPKRELISLLSTRILIDFAIEKGIQLHSKTKKDIIRSILDSTHELEYLIDYHLPLESNNSFVRLHIPNRASLKNYLLTEIVRLRIYLEYIAKTENRQTIKVEAVRTSNVTRRGDYFDNIPQVSQEQPINIPADYFLNRISDREKNIIENHWDCICDQILVTTQEETPLKIPTEEALKKVVQYWSNIDILESVQRKLLGVKSRPLKWILQFYLEYKIRSNAYYQLNSNQHVCQGCGKYFREWSVRIDYALKTNKNIKFCNSCYSYIFNHRYYANTTEFLHFSDEDMLTLLFELANAMKSIPTMAFMTNVKLASFSPEQQILVGRGLLNLPSYDMYIERFKSWLKSLILAGILSDGSRKTTRGIQSIAKDGHVCLSLAERIIDDWLTSHNISHEKEVLYPYDAFLNPNTALRADWKIKELYLEFAGMMDDHEYKMRMNNKVELAKKSNIQLIILLPEDLENLNAKFQSFLLL